MESYRTQSGPRQKKILDLGTLDLDKQYFKALADRIEDLVYGRTNLIPASEEIESLAAYYSSLIVKKTVTNSASGAIINKEVIDYENIDLNSLNVLNVRTIGAEYTAYSMIKELEFDKFLQTIGFSSEHTIDALASIIAKLVHPSSEHNALKWLKSVSGLEKLLDASFTRLPLNRLYRISDKLLEHKEEIEEYLKNKERDLFSLKENIILYDLTNTYFEGSMNNADKAAYGRSKEKRSDCPLLTLALVIDEKGFIKKTKIFKGNVSEPKTLSGMLDSFEKNATVVMDAGIASEDNIELLKEKGFNYICVSRKKYDMDTTGAIPLDGNLSVKLYRTEKESILYCESKGKKIKETSIADKARASFENKLNLMIEGLTKKHTSKSYDKIHERISRLKEKYSSISQYYTIKIEHNEIVEKISYIIDESKISKAFSGSYYIRTNRTDLDERNIKEIYTLLLQIENSFRTLKSQLALRPNFHQKQDRIEAHIFITTLAYRLLNSITYKLKAKNINKSWKSLNLELSTHTVNTLSM
ncbi:MAG: IS1634 family transposase, partial [Thermoplasmata archaeon]